MGIWMYLLVILLVLMIIVGGKRGVKSFFSLCFNFIALFSMLILMAANVEPIKVTVYGCIIITLMTLFYINGFNVKTIAAIISVVLTIMLTIVLTYKIGSNAKIQGLSSEEIEGVSNMVSNIHLDFSKIFMCQVLIGLLGAIIDASISISSSMNEIYKNNLSITEMNLFKSGIKIGKDILGTMTNTLLFAYIGGFMYLMIFFNIYSCSIIDILNKKVFCVEIFQILCGGIGIILIIPITAFITSKMLFLKYKRGSV